MGVAVGSNAAAGTGPDSVSPKRFKREMGALRDQFAGDEQHDAQEDLNLVHEKPYTEQPDSDGRPDKVLADIWWENHLKRELSVIQSIFTGQFKSITRCTKCEYNSARFEPFNMLSVPLPEDEKRSVVVHIVPIALAVSGGVIRCSVRVLKNGTIRDVANIVKTYDMDGITKDALFVAMEMSMGRVINVHSMLRKLDMVRESDSLYFFEVSGLSMHTCHHRAVSEDVVLHRSVPSHGIDN
ncbi:Usp15 [Symbiodinium microadriaticum]|nr:Usp15 [Symbiodinium microadriaticum]